MIVIWAVIAMHCSLEKIVCNGNMYLENMH